MNFRLLIGLLCGLLLSGCQTPDLKPFVSASATVVTSINQGGDMVIAPLAGQAVMVNNRLVLPSDPEHPAAKLLEQWQSRRRAADAILVYSGSLAAINDASTSRKANATALVDSVRQLAAAIPQLNVGSNAAGNLLVSGISAVVEVKAWHDMNSAVKSADPVIQMIAGIMKQDFVDLAAQYASQQRNQLMTSTVPALRELERDYDALKARQRLQRTLVAQDPANVAAGAELTRLDGLIAGLEPDLNSLRAERARLDEAVATGRSFYAAAGNAIDAWAAAHHDLARAFEENRGPNLALLAARAQELNVLIQDLKNENKAKATP